MNVMTPDEGRTFVFTLQRGGEVISQNLVNTGLPIDRGVWKEGSYEKGDGVSLGGEYWIAKREIVGHDKPQSAAEFCVVAVLRGSNVRGRHIDADQLSCRQRVRQPEQQRPGATSKIEQSNWSIPWNMLEHDVAHPIRPLRWRGAGLCGKSACGVARHTDSNSTRAGVLNANRSGRSLMYSRNLR